METGQCLRLSTRHVQRVLASLEAELELVVRWRGGELDRLIDEGHASLVAAVARRLAGSGWIVEAEVTYAIGGERGSIDLVALNPETRALLVVEVKADVASAEGTLRKHDEKVRLGAIIVRERFGWQVMSVSRLLVLPESTTARRRIERHRALFDHAYPERGRRFTAWLRSPERSIRAILFIPTTKVVGVRREIGSRRRVSKRPAPVREQGSVPGAIGFPRDD